MQIVDYINALPDAYKKNPESNNYKLLLMEQRLVADWRADTEAVHATLDIYKSKGETLDLYGSIYGQARGGMTDEQYRYIILQKAVRCHVGCDTNSVIEALATIFECAPTDFGLGETENDCEVEITSLPYAILQHIGLTGSQIYEIISGLLPCGVRLADLNLDGTFEFSAVADEASDDKGFADIEQTIGGYLGLLATDDIDIPT